ncbi:MAG: hypothetical protein MUF24_12385 [Chitinophagaceae bacterium]|nr:hypothetical protein [Chitinophagaceae bacterium]
MVHIAHHWLILHGRYTCTARSPQCENCGLQGFCRYYEQQLKAKSRKEAKVIMKS